MTLLRIELLSQESEISITSADRVYTLQGGDHLSLSDLIKFGDTITIKLIKAAVGADKYRGVPQNDHPEFKPLKPSGYAGICTVDANGQETFIGSAKPVKKGKR